MVELSSIFSETEYIFKFININLKIYFVSEKIELSSTIQR